MAHSFNAAYISKDIFTFQKFSKGNKNIKTKVMLTLNICHNSLNLP